jgi:hypothetical protein
LLRSLFRSGDIHVPLHDRFTFHLNLRSTRPSEQAECHPALNEPEAAERRGFPM